MEDFDRLACDLIEDLVGVLQHGHDTNVGTLLSGPRGGRPSRESIDNRMNSAFNRGDQRGIVLGCVCKDLIEIA